MKILFALAHAYFVLLFALTPDVINAAPGDERWDNQFFEPGTGSSMDVIRCMVVANDGSLLCGGNFSIPDVVEPNLCRWDGVRWNSFGGGVAQMPGNQATVFAMAIDGIYTYIAGRFVSVGGTSVTNLARWNGTAWESVGGGAHGGSVRALVVTNGEVTIGGTFTNVGGIRVNYLAKWDGANWTDCDGGVLPTNFSENSPPVAALLLRNNELYVGGSFTNAGGTSATNVAKWNGSNWHSLGQDSENGVNGHVMQLAADSQGNVLVGGDFLKAGSSNITLLARWNGTDWSQLADGISRPSIGMVSALSVAGTNVYAGGFFIRAGTNFLSGFARWDGIKWHSSPAAVREAVTSIATKGETVYVAGKLSSVMAPDHNGVAKFDGESWSVIGSGIVTTVTPPQVAAMSVSDSAVQVGGRFSGQASNPQLTAEWNGKSWERLDGLGKSISTRVLALAHAKGKTYAAGSFCCAQDDTANHVAVREGTNWAILGSGLPATGRALAVRGTEVLAGHDGGISRWDGTSWSSIGNGMVGGVRSIVCRGKHLYAGGSFSIDGISGATNIARWDGTNWHSLGEGLDGPVFALASYGANLYAGGKFTNASGTMANRIARWDGVNWTSLGGFFAGVALPGGNTTSDIHAAVYALNVASDGTLFAAGNFTSASTHGINFIAKWSGSNWLPLGSGANGTITAMSIKDQNLYVGGEFWRTGTNSSFHFGRWSLEEQLVKVAASAPTSVQTGSNLTYTITVKNLGQTASQNSVLQAKLPSGTDFAAAVPGGTVIGEYVNWNLGDLNTNDEAVVTLSVHVIQTNGFIVLEDYLVTNDSGKVFRGEAAFSTVVDDRLRMTLNGDFQDDTIPLRIDGLPGMTFALQLSTNLVDWENLSTNTLVGNHLDLSVTNDPPFSRFYRLLLIP